jgi:CheY-like chemotaxis protein
MLLGVINDILDFSKIEAGKLDIESIETSITHVVGSVMDIVSERAREKSLTIRVTKHDDLPDGFLSDPIRVQQILANLLTNAIKFTDAGSVSLDVGRENQNLFFRITDTGIGMTEEQMSRIFTPFEQADGSTTRKFGGTGLGLAIVKRIVDLMGGEIRVSSVLEQGSTFEVSLPFLPVNAAASAERPDVAEMVVGDGQPLRGIRILVAEDNEINQEILVSNLLEDGASVVAVCNGRAAVDRIIADGAKAYDIVLMDIQMPEMNGHEATREILRLAPDIPIIGQTAHALTEEIDACFTSGMVGYIGKPINPNKLVETVLEFARRT